jgi:glutaredoxin
MARFQEVAAMTEQPYTIYVSGDPGSQTLRGMFSRKGVPFETRDIREQSVGGKRYALLRLLDLGLRTVPQVFLPNGMLLGGFEAAESHLASL